MTIGVGSYGVAIAAYVGISALLLSGWISRHWAIVGLIATTLLWALAGLWGEIGGGSGRSVYALLDLMRVTALLFLVNDALRRLAGDRHSTKGGFLVPLAGAGAVGYGVLQMAGIGDADFSGMIVHVGLAVLGLFLIENLYQTSRPNALWSSKHLAIGAGSIFAFDLFQYTDALLLLRVDSTIRATQPLVAVLALPLILISARRLNEVRISLPVSRGLLVSTTALLASGIYILSVATIAFLIRELGWAWGPALQVVLLIGAAMVLLVLFSSTSVRHGGRRFIERNLFTFAYDYRREWLRLVEAMAGTDQNLPLNQRAMKATATLLDADGGVLFLRGPNRMFNYQTCWNIALESHPPPPPSGLLRALSAERTAIAFDQPETQPTGFRDDVEIGNWLGHFKGPWVALALLAQDDLVGVIVVTRPRLKRKLTWEDLDLLAIFSHQLGSYITVEELTRHVAEAEHFDRLSKQVTFVAHDLKSLISQLSLMLQQASRHAHDPAFVSDSFLTIGDAVEKMKALMQRVQQADASSTSLAMVDLSALAKEALRSGRCDRLDPWRDGVMVRAESGVLAALLGHVIDNAHQACRNGGDVALALRTDAGSAMLEVIDSGVGMTRNFVDTELFRPFASTKDTGFGIGMYQCRDWIERWGGRLEVESEPGHGTTVRIVLPLARPVAGVVADGLLANQERAA